MILIQLKSYKMYGQGVLVVEVGTVLGQAVVVKCITTWGVGR
jgi:hypothetical protein